MKNYTTLKRIFESILSVSEDKPEYRLDNKEFHLLDSFESDEFIGYEVKHTATSTRCKNCFQRISSIKGNKISYCNYDLVSDKTVILKIHKKLYYCLNCRCSTISSIDSIKKGNQKSEKLISMIQKELVNKKETYTDVAKRYHVSIRNVIHQFDQVEEPEIFFENISAISIDEVRFILGESSFQCIISNADTGEIIGILENRYKPTVQDFFKKHLNHVSVVAQDFWDTYRSCAQMIQAEVCVDKFHFVRFGIWAYGRTRVDLQKKENLRLMQTWKLQNKSRKSLSKASKRKLERVLKNSKRLEKAYKAKEWYLHLSRENNLNRFREGIEKWRTFVLKHKLTEFYPIFTTLDNWGKEIENMLTLPYSNGKAERINRDIKQAKNAAFGYRNFKRSSKLMKLRSIA